MLAEAAGGRLAGLFLPPLDGEQPLAGLAFPLLGLEIVENSMDRTLMVSTLFTPEESAGRHHDLHRVQ